MTGQSRDMEGKSHDISSRSHDIKGRNHSIKSRSRDIKGQSRHIGGIDCAILVLTFLVYFSLWYVLSLSLHSLIRCELC